MTIAIKRENGDMIYFDAVLRYSRQYSSTVSKHPVEDKSPISDHITLENPTFSFRGVVSNVDMMEHRPDNYNRQIVSNTGELQFIRQKRNNMTLVKVETTLLQSVMGNYFPPPKPIVVVDHNQEDYQSIVLSTLEEIRRKKEIVSLVEYEALIGTEVLQVKQPIHTNMVITSYSIDEDPNTGDVLEIEVTLERVKFVPLRETIVPDDVVESLKDQADDAGSKGDQTGTPKEIPPNTTRARYLSDMGVDMSSSDRYAETIGAVR